MTVFSVGDVISYQDIGGLPADAEFRRTEVGHFEITKLPELSEREKLEAELMEEFPITFPNSAEGVAKWILYRFERKVENDSLDFVTDADDDEWVRNAYGTYDLPREQKYNWSLRMIKEYYSPVLDNEGKQL